MEGKKSKPRAILVFGAPCSGKTTFAEKFAEKFDLTYYNLNEIEEKYQFSHDVIVEILEIIAQTKRTLVIEGGVDTEAERRALRQAFRKVGYNVALVWIQTDVANIRMRLRSRYKTVAEAKRIYEEAVASMEAPTYSEKPIILSGKHTFETQTKHVLSGLANVNKR